MRNTNSPEEKSEISGGGRILSAFGFIFGFFTDVRNDINCNEKNKVKIHLISFEKANFILWALKVLSTNLMLNCIFNVCNENLLCCQVQHHVPKERPTRDFYGLNRWHDDIRCYFLALVVDDRVHLLLEKILHYWWIAKSVWLDSRNGRGMDESPIFHSDKHCEINKYFSIRSIFQNFKIL